MNTLIEDFKDRIRYEGRSFKWFHKTYLTDVTYPYFIIQLNEDDRLHDEIKKAIQTYLDEV